MVVLLSLLVFVVPISERVFAGVTYCFLDLGEVVNIFIRACCVAAFLNFSLNPTRE